MKKSIVSLVLVAAAGPTLTAEPSVERLLSCTDIRNSRDRLACFDREVAPLASARVRPELPPSPAGGPPPVPVASNRVPVPVTVPAPTPSSTPTPGPAPAPLQTPSFGQEQLAPKFRAEVPAEELTLHARIERLRIVTANDFIVYLDNGQAWSHQDQVLGAYLRQGEAITISRAALGSYRLTRDAGSSKNWIRVTRIR
jgi:hypothetical protein